MSAGELTDDALRRKRLRIRCWRRGMKEMDLILGPYADARLAAMNGPMLTGLERLLDENDQDLYAWTSGREPVPEAHATALGDIRSFHDIN